MPSSLSENKINPPARVLDAELHFLSMAHILVDTLHVIPIRLVEFEDDTSKDVSIKFLIDRAKAALKELNHEAVTGFERELKRIGIYLDEVERYLNERKPI